ncbi:hypothetical protein GJAV_G00108700 [Gymnothorax javanicus]|nr:hypothetical protein GJAV_G00108700 [Gymnothorax javanicus]
MSGRIRTHSLQKASSDGASAMKMGGHKPESERDSGFSDASSEHLSAMDQGDSDGATRGSLSGPRASRLVMGAQYSGLSPMIFMNNVVLKQPNDAPPSPKPWGARPTIEVLPHPQVVFLQPMVSADPSLQRRGSAKHRRSKHKKYLPILKSYPKIAPHPGDSSSTEQGSTSRTERCSSASDQWGRNPGQKQPSCPTGVVLLTPPALPVPSSPRAPSPQEHPAPQETAADVAWASEGPKQPEPPNSSTECALSSSITGPSSPLAEAQALTHSMWAAEGPPDEDEDSKRKRFCNTYNILSQSGLLDITLRVKELIRQNRSSQGQLERLQGQAALFLEAVRSGSPEVWSRLQRAMLEPAPEAGEDEVKCSPQRLP